MEAIHLGRLEIIEMPDFGTKKIIAKSDTGAFSSAVHCEYIKLRTNDDGDKALVYQPLGKEFDEQQTTDYSLRSVKSSNGMTEDRYFITTTIIIGSQKYAIELGLTDRSEMKWPVLIGRKFLRKHGILVDVDKPKTTKSLVRRLEKL